SKSTSNEENRNRHGSPKFLAGGVDRKNHSMRGSAAMARSIVGRVAGSRILWMVILLLVGGYFRVTAVQQTEGVSPIRADALEYYMSAHNLVQYGIYSRSTVALDDPKAIPQPDAYRWPGMPLMIAPFMSLWPDHARILSRVQLVNIALGLITVAA